MSTYITDGTTTITVDAVDGFSSSRDPGIRLHPILGAASPDITYQTAKLRTGTLPFRINDEATAAAAEALHCNGSIITVVSTDRATVNFSYVPVDGDSVRREMNVTRTAWIVEVDFQEVSA